MPPELIFFIICLSYLLLGFDPITLILILFIGLILMFNDMYSKYLYVQRDLFNEHNYHVYDISCRDDTDVY